MFNHKTVLECCKLYTVCILLVCAQLNTYRVRELKAFSTGCMYDKFNSSLLVFSHFERMCCIKTEVKSQLNIEDFLLY